MMIVALFTAVLVLIIHRNGWACGILKNDISNLRIIFTLRYKLGYESKKRTKYPWLDVLTMNYWASGGPVSQQLCSQAPGCWYFPAGSCVTNGRLCHLLFSVPNDRASSSNKGWKPLVILAGRRGKGCWQTFLANEGLCPTSCNLVIPETARSYTTITPQVPPTPNLPHPLDIRLDTGLWIGGISAGWKGAKSPWLPLSSNWLFHILVCPGINCPCSAFTVWDQTS